MSSSTLLQLLPKVERPSDFVLAHFVFAVVVAASIFE
jgi:hypothetical protein